MLTNLFEKPVYNFMRWDYEIKLFQTKFNTLKVIIQKSLQILCSVLKATFKMMQYHKGVVSSEKQKIF